jgi:hypothetical protein
MKRIVCTFFALLALISNAYAFSPWVIYTVDQDSARARITNRYGKPIVCSGVFYGFTKGGATLRNYFPDHYIDIDQKLDAFLYGSYYDPFTRVWAEVNCEYHVGPAPTPAPPQEPTPAPTPAPAL